MKEIREKMYRCVCGTKYERTRGEDGRQAEEVYNTLLMKWEDCCPYCGCPVGSGGELEDNENE